MAAPSAGGRAATPAAARAAPEPAVLAARLTPSGAEAAQSQEHERRYAGVTPDAAAVPRAEAVAAAANDGAANTRRASLRTAAAAPPLSCFPAAPAAPQALLAAASDLPSTATPACAGRLAPGASAAAAAAPAAATARRMPPQPQFRRAGRLGISADDREELRRLAAQLADTPRRWKAIADSDFGRRLGLDHRQLRHALKNKAYQPSTAPVAWSEALQSALVAEVASRGRAWASIRRDGAGGAFAAFNVETLRRNYDHPSAHRAGYRLGGQRVHGMTQLPRGQYRVTFRDKLLGQCDGLAEAARMWNAAARAAGVPPDRLNAVPDDGAASELQAPSSDVSAQPRPGGNAPSPPAERDGDDAQRCVSSACGFGSEVEPPEEEEMLGARILGALAALPPRLHCPR